MQKIVCHGCTSNTSRRFNFKHHLTVSEPNFVIVISKLLRRQKPSAPANSLALRRIKGRFFKGGSREAQVRFPEYQEGTE